MLRYKVCNDWDPGLLDYIYLILPFVQCPYFLLVSNSHTHSVTPPTFCPCRNLTSSVLNGNSVRTISVQDRYEGRKVKGGKKVFGRRLVVTGKVIHKPPSFSFFPLPFTYPNERWSGWGLEEDWIIPSGVRPQFNFRQTQEWF